MKTEYKKVSELLALEDAEVLKEFEMVELQGGNLSLTRNYGLDSICPPIVGSGCSNTGCPCVGSNCQLNP